MALQAVGGTAWAVEPVTIIHNLNGGLNPLIIPATDPNAPLDYLITGTWNGGDRPVIIRSGFNGTVTLMGVDIKATEDYWTSSNKVNVGNAIDIEDNAHVTLKLMGDNFLRMPNSSVDWHPATLHVSENAYLTIESYDGVDAHGTLTVYAGSHCSGAAIGGNMNTASVVAADASTSGHITINSGTIITTGGDDSAGIGGSSYGGAGGYITINGGTVRATCDATAGGANSGAAIGSGFACKSSDTYITITGGDVTAVSLITNNNKLCGAAIGAGNADNYNPAQGNFGYIVITGGKIKASVRGRFNLDGSYQGNTYQGRDGVAIGGGARAEASGTIIILPSADVSELYGGNTYENGTTQPGWDIGNCSNIFYLNKANPYVSVGSSGRQEAKSFTARLDPLKDGVGVYAHVYAADAFEELKSVASQVGITPSSGIIGLNPDRLYYFTNSIVDFFTNAQPDNASQPYEIKTFPDSYITTASFPPHKSDNPESVEAKCYDVEIKTTTPSYNFGLSTTNWATTTPPSSPLTYGDGPITLDFGSAEYNRQGPTGTFDPARAFGIKNTGNLWLDIRVDSANTNVRYFDLDGPVVSPPAVEGGAHLPVGTTGVITATLKQQVPVGQLRDTLTLTATIPGTSTTITREVYLQIDVTQQAVDGQTEAWVVAKNPAPPAPADTVKTNANTVRLNARAGMPSVDGVKTVWYKISIESSNSFESSKSSGYVPSGESDWAEVPATPVNGKLGYNFQFEADLPDQTVCYIHWFVETVNTIGSRSGVIGPYDVKRNSPEPVITGVSSIGVAPVTLAIDFTGNPLEAGTMLTADMFSITDGIVSNIVPDGPNRYKFDVTASGNDVSITFPQIQVRDEYGNRNPASSSTYTLSYNNGIPQADFDFVGGVDSVYFVQPSTISFRVSSGLGSQRLFRNDGTTEIVGGATAYNTFTIGGTAPAAGDIIFIPAPPHNTFAVNALTYIDGAYEIKIQTDDIKNELGSGIRDTTYIFKVYRLALSHTSLHTFPAKNEGYPAFTPEVVSITNSGSLTATGLTATLSGADATAFAVSAPAATLPGSGTTSFTVAPVTGLLLGTYTATVTVWSHGNKIGEFSVSFTVTRISAPNAIIDFVNETFVNLNVDTAYVFNGSSPVAPDETGAVPISENWMTGTTNGLSAAKVDPDYGALGTAQQITVPLRPPAPVIRIQNASASNVNDGMITGVNDSMEYRTGETDEWIAVPTGVIRLEDLPPGVYHIRYRAIAGKSFASYIAVADVLEPATPILIREVTLPETPGIIILPREGVHYINSGEYFLFTLIFEGDTPPMVRTNRIIDGKREVLTGIPNGTGGYVYLIPIIRETVVVEITPHDVAVEAVGGISVWAYGNAIRIESPQRTVADIYSVSGLLLQRINVAPGINTVQAASGVYLVVLPSGVTYKVTVK
jgi:hypothetical protein